MHFSRRGIAINLWPQSIHSGVTTLDGVTLGGPLASDATVE